MSDSLPAPGGSSGSSGSLSNAKIQIEKKIAESKAKTLGRKMLAEYCTQMNKQMVKNVDIIISKLDIDNQDEIFKNVAKQFFDDDLKEMYIDEMKRRQTISIKKNLRGILYDHFKDDLKIEKEEERKREEADSQAQAGGTEKAAGGPPEGEEEEEEVEDEEEEEQSSGSSGEDAAGMSLEILNKINDRILTDDDFINQVKEGIIGNITSGSFKAALQRGVFAKLEPQLESMIETKVKEILDNDELKNAALDVTKGQQAQYNKQHGGKKRSIKKSKKPTGKKTRKHKQ